MPHATRPAAPGAHYAQIKTANKNWNKKQNKASSKHWRKKFPKVKLQSGHYFIFVLYLYLYFHLYSRWQCSKSKDENRLPGQCRLRQCDRTTVWLLDSLLGLLSSLSPSISLSVSICLNLCVYETKINANKNNSRLIRFSALPAFRANKYNKESAHLIICPHRHCLPIGQSI